MQFGYDDDQEEFRGSLRRFLADKAPLSAVRAAADTDAGYDPALWRQMCDQLGLAGLHLPEEYDGAGTTLTEPAIVLEETGRALSSAPYLPTLLASLAILRLGSEEQRKGLLPAIAAGHTIGTLALAEPRRPAGDAALDTQAVARGAEATLTGAKTLVPHGHVANLLVVSARRGDATGAEDVQLYLVQGDAAGLTRTRLDALDLSRPLARVEFEGAAAVPLGDTPTTRAELSALVDTAGALLAAEMTGGVDAVLDMAVQYAKDRQQFNRPIGSFQAIKHRCAEIAVALDTARAAAQYAVMVAGEQGPAGESELATVGPLATAEAAEAFTFAASWNIQIHGGIGFTWEHDAHLYLRRAQSSARLFGDPAAQRAKLADRIGL